MEATTQTLERRILNQVASAPEQDVKILKQDDISMWQINETGKKDYRAMSQTDLVEYITQMKAENENLKQRNSELEKQAMTDTLTGIPNRKYADDYITKQEARAKRYGEDFSVGMLDIDYFKKVNDKFGHDVGDKVLKEVAQTIKRYIRTEDCAARYGGEEFVVVLAGADQADLKKKMEDLKTEIGYAVRTPDGKPVTVSMGLAPYNPEKYNVMKEADNLLYLSKEKGRNRVTSIYDNLKEYQTRVA